MTTTTTTTNGLVDSATNENLREPDKTNRPSDSKFKQQKLPAWQPILTAGTVLPTFFVIGLIFIPCGVGFLVSSNWVFEKIIDYSDCVEYDVKTQQFTKQMCKEIEPNITVGQSLKCFCKESFNISEDITKQVFVYYSLTNYYQNHRRYVKSRDDKQLLGNIDLYSGGKMNKDCDPFLYTEEKVAGGSTQKFGYVPCGAIANSLFNDTFKIWYQSNELTHSGDLSKDHSVLVKFIETGIAWETDKTTKFQNPEAAKNCGSFRANETVVSEAQMCWRNAFKFNETRRPAFWLKDVWLLDPENPENNGFKNEHFIVWMRTAALPNFRKLYAKVDPVNGIYLKKGEYHLLIDYNYPVQNFSGKKRIILSTSSWLGGKNPFLGVAYIVVGSLCVLLGVVFFVIHIKFGKSLAEMSTISN